MSILSKKVKQSEKKIQKVGKSETEKFNKLIAENTSDLIAITEFGIKAKFLYLNLAYTRLLGYESGELIGTSGMDFIHPEDQVNLRPLLIKYLKDKTLKLFGKKSFKVDEKIEYRIKDKRGNWHLLASTVNMADNKIIFVSKDITEQKKAEEKLKKSEENLKKAEAIGRVGSWEYNLSSNKLWGSNQAKKIFGLNLESDVFNIEEVEKLIQEKEKVHQTFEDLLKKNKPYDIEYKIITKNLKKTISVRSIAELVFDKKSNKPIKIVGTIRDVTDQKKAKEVLKLEKNKLQTYLNLVGVMIVALDKNQKVILVNKTGAKILGYKKDEVLGKNWFDNFIPKERKQAVKTVYDKLIAGKEKITEYYENEIITKLGEKRLIAWYNTFLRDEKDKVIGVLSSGEDVTEKKKMAEKMINSAKEWSETFDSMSDGISLHSPDHVIVNVNQSLCNMLGKTKEELIDKKCFSIFHDKNQPIAECPMVYTLKNKKEKQVEIFEQKFNKWLSIYTSPIMNKNGQIVKVIHVVRDITERKKAEEEIAKRNRELEKFNDLMVGRESRMVDLKKKIKDLEAQIR